MKKALLILLILMFCYNLSFSGNFDNCVSVNTTIVNDIGGRYKPSEGNFHVLIVFAQFKDDNYLPNNSFWVVNKAPANMNGWIDETWSQNPTEGSLTHFYNVMSNNKFKLTGKTVSVTTQYNRDYYLSNNLKRGDIHKELLLNLDSTWDFAEFDNWDYVSQFNHDNVPDTIVDMVIFVWRNIASDRPDPATDISKLNFTSSFGNIGGNDFEVDGGSRTIGANYSGNGSGVTVNGYLDFDPFRTAIHELSHYFFGGNSYHNGFGFWGMLSAWGIRSYMANSWERYKLGWMNSAESYTITDSPVRTLTDQSLGDYLESGNAFRFVIDEQNNKYFYIENHQKINYWENNTPFWKDEGISGNITKGIYVIRRDGNLSEADPSSWLQCIPAEGRFNWEVNQSTPNPWGAGDLPVFKQLGANVSNGYHDLQKIPHSYAGVPNPDVIHFTEDANGNPKENIKFKGEENDAFKIGYNEVFSSWSNPNNQKKDGVTTPFGFYVKGESNGVSNLDIYVGTSISAPPSKPLNLVVGPSSDRHPLLVWDSNLETDIYKYKIYKKVSLETNWEYLASTTDTIFEDLTERYIIEPEAFTTYIYYAVSAADNSLKESVKSNEYKTKVKGSHLEKKNSISFSNNNPKFEVLDYDLAQNYPNPFNPTTTINYALSKNGHVVLKIYNHLGQEVKTLVNKYKEKGSHSIKFNASDLPSGLYIYSIQVNNFTQSKKLILLK